MADRFVGPRWPLWLGLVLVVAAAGYFGYTAGVAHGAAELARSGHGAGPPYGSGWHGHWHPFGFVFPFFGLLFWILVVRLLFWGAWGRGCGWYGPNGPAGRFDDWHREAHARMERDAARPSGS